MSLDRVINKLGSRIIRPSQYEVYINFSGIRAFSANASGAIAWQEHVPDNGYLSMYAENVTMPGRQMLSRSNTTHGAAREIAYESAFSGEISITFRYSYDDPGMAAGMRRLMDYWMDSISDPVSGQVNYYNWYTTTMDIALVDSSVQDSFVTPFAIRVNEVYPKTITDIELGHALGEDYLRNTVTFAYRDYEYIA
tara:strand:- start:484 stop:1068 length:585 start_codon:yes stop_codon:yes gene_type:complete